MKIEIVFTEKQKAFDQAVETYPVTFFGGAKGGGKSRGLRNVLLKRLLQRAGTHSAIFRRTYEELEANHIRKILEEHPSLVDCYNKQEHLITLPNGSTLEFCHCRYPADVDLYQGREFDDLAIDEVGQWSEGMFQTLRGSNRTSKPGIKPRLLLTGNPGGIGHKWLKRLFVDRDYNSREDPADYGFVASRVYDNPALMENDPDYVKRLEAEPNEVLRRAFLYGDWDLQAGQFFNELSREVHLLHPAFVVQPHWRRFGSFDPGFNHPATFGWFAVDEDGNVCLYRYYLARGQRIDQIAAYIHQFPDSKALYEVVAGGDAFARGREGSPSIETQFRDLPENLRLRLMPANIDRIQGAAMVRAYLAHKDLPTGIVGPRFFIAYDCKPVFENLANMIHDPSRPEDVLKVDATDTDVLAGDDLYDMVRMGLMSRPLKAKPVVEERTLTAEEARQVRAQRWMQRRIKQSERGKHRCSHSQLSV